MWPMVPTLTCGLVREKTSLAINSSAVSKHVAQMSSGFGVITCRKTKSCRWGLHPRPAPYQGAALLLRYGSRLLIPPIPQLVSPAACAGAFVHGGSSHRQHRIWLFTQGELASSVFSRTVPPPRIFPGFRDDPDPSHNRDT